MAVTASAAWSHCFDLGQPQAALRNQVSIQSFPGHRMTLWTLGSASLTFVVPYSNERSLMTLMYWFQTNITQNNDSSHVYSSFTVQQNYSFEDVCDCLSPRADFTQQAPAVSPEHFITFSATVDASVIKLVTLTYPQVSGCDASSMKSYYKQFGAWRGHHVYI